MRRRRRVRVSGRDRVGPLSGYSPRAGLTTARSPGRAPGPDHESDRRQRPMRRRREVNRDGVAGTHLAAGNHDPHDTGLADQTTLCVPIEYGVHQAWSEEVQLLAGVAQAGNLDHGLADREPGARRQGQQIEAAGGDVLAHVARPDLEPLCDQRLVQFGVKQMDLAQVGLRRIASHPRPMLDGHAGMTVALHAKPGQQGDRGLFRLGKAVVTAAADRNNMTRSVQGCAALSLKVKPGGAAVST